MTISYQVHGKFNFETKDNILLLEVLGPWNIEFFHDLHEQLTTQVRAMACYPYYGVLLSPVGEAIIVSEAVEYHIKFLKQGANKQTIAINLASCQTIAITKSIFTKLYMNSGVKFEFFNDEESALTWLKCQLH